MIRQAAYFAMAISLSSPCLAQQVMDGSDKQFPSGTVQQIVSKLMKITKDPFSAQIAGLHPSKSDPADICGVVNLKNGYGAYTGFEPFILYGGTLYLQTSDQCR